MKYFVDGLNSININGSVVTLQFANLEREEDKIVISDKHEIVLTKESLDNAKRLIEQIYDKIEQANVVETKEEQIEEKVEEQTEEVVEKKKGSRKKKSK